MILATFRCHSSLVKVDSPLCGYKSLVKDDAIVVGFMSLVKDDAACVVTCPWSNLFMGLHVVGQS